MELAKKTTILFSPELHEHLVKLAKQRGTSLGQLVRAACEIHYGYATPEDRLSAVEALRTFTLPVGSPRQMKEESVVAPQDLLP